MIQGSSGFNIDITINAFKRANSQNKSVEIVHGHVFVTGNQKSSSSVSELDYFVHKHILNQDLDSSPEKQILLLKEIEIYYKGLEGEIDKIRSAIKDSPLVMKGPKHPSLKVSPVFDQIAKTSKKLDQKLTLLQQSIIKRKEEYEEYRKKALNIFFEVSQRHSELAQVGYADLQKAALEKHIFHLGVKDAELTEETGTLDALYRGNNVLLRAQNAASYTDHLLYRILYEGDFSSGIYADADIEGLIRISQQRKNLLNYAFQLEILYSQIGKPEFSNSLLAITSTIQRNIDLLDDPTSDKIISVKNKNSFVLPGAWRSMGGGGHYISYEIKKEGDDYYFLIHNRGELVSEFPQLHNNITFKEAHTGKTYSKTTACIKTTKAAIADPEFLQKLIISYNNPNFNPRQSYWNILNHFILSNKGTVVQTDTEKELEKIYKKMFKAPTKEKEELNARALELMKEDSHFQSRQLYGTCTESNYATVEIGISSSYTLECIERYMLAHMVDKLGRRILNPAFKEKEINLVLLKKHVDHRINQLKQKIEGAPKSDKGSPTTIFKDSYIFKQPLTKAEKKPFIDGIKAGTLKFRYLPKFLKTDPDIVLAALDINALDLQYAPESFKGDKALVLALKKQNPLSLAYASKNIKDTFPLFAAERSQFLEALQKREITLQSLPKKLQDDREIVLAAVEMDGLAIKHASDRLRGDLELARLSIDQNISALDFISNKIPLSQLFTNALKQSLIMQLERGVRTFASLPIILKQDEDLALAGVRNNGLSLRDLPDSLKGNEEMVLAALKQNGLAFQYAAENLKENVKIVEAALKKNILVFDYLSPNIFEQPFIKELIESIKQDILKGKKKYSSLPKRLKNNEELVIAAVTRNGLVLSEVSDSFKGNEKVVRAAVEQNGLALQYASENLKEKIEIIQIALQENTSALNYTSLKIPFEQFFTKKVIDVIRDDVLAGKKAFSSLLPQLKNNEELVVAAVKRDGLYLYFVPEPFKSNEKVVLAAVEHDGLALQYATKGLRENIQIAKAALKQNILSLSFVPEKFSVEQLFTNEEIDKIKKDLLTGRILFSSLHPRLKNNEGIAIAAVTRNGLVLKDVPESLKGNEKVVHAAVERDGLALQYASQNLQENVQIAITALKQNILAIEYVSAKIPTDQVLTKDIKDIVLNDLRNSRISLNNLPELFKDDPENIMANSKENYPLASVRLRSNREFMLKIIKMHPEALTFASKQLLDDPQFLLEASKNGDKRILLMVPTSFQKNEKFMKQLISENVKYYEAIHEDLKMNEELALLALSKNVDIFNNLSNGLKNNPGFMRKALKVNSKLLESFKKEIMSKTDANHALELVRNDPLLVIYAPESLKQNPEFWNKALAIDVKLIEYAPDEIRSNENLILELMQKHKDYTLVRYASDNLKQNFQFMVRALDMDVRALEFAHSNLKGDKNLVLAALKSLQDPKNGAFGKIDNTLYLTDDLLAQKSFVIDAASLDFMLLGLAPDFFGDEDVLLAAIKNNKEALSFAAPELIAKPEFLIKALRVNFECIEFVSRELLQEPAFLMEALKINRNVLKKTSLLKDLVFMKEVLEIYPDVLDIFPVTFKDELTKKINALKNLSSTKLPWDRL